jgi:hypothetical protein
VPEEQIRSASYRASGEGDVHGREFVEFRGDAVIYRPTQTSSRDDQRPPTQTGVARPGQYPAGRDDECRSGDHTVAEMFVKHDDSQDCGEHQLQVQQQRHRRCRCLT